MLTGATQWFNHKAKSSIAQSFQKSAETERKEFLTAYSKDIIERMNGEDPLSNVFGPDNSMMEQLFNSSTFGSLGWQAKMW